jgi:hypothetical protein
MDINKLNKHLMGDNYIFLCHANIAVLEGNEWMGAIIDFYYSHFKTFFINICIHTKRKVTVNRYLFYGVVNHDVQSVIYLNTP